MSLNRLELYSFGLAVVFAGLLALVWGLRAVRTRVPGRELVFGALLLVVIGVGAGLSWWHNTSGEGLAVLFGSEASDWGVSEWGTLAALLASTGLAIALARRTRGLARIGFLLLAPACFFIAGEEASWGQWFFGWQTPEALARVNLQEETNLHNLVNPRLYDYVYIVAGWAILLGTAGILLAPRRWFGALARPATLAGLLGTVRAWFARTPVGLILLASSGALLQHEVFEEYAEMVVFTSLALALYVMERGTRARAAQAGAARAQAAGA